MRIEALTLPSFSLPRSAARKQNPDGYAGTVPVAVAMKAVQEQSVANSLVKAWEQELDQQVQHLRVAPDNSLMVNLPNRYAVLSAEQGTVLGSQEHELLQTPPIVNADGSGYLVGSWGVARVEPDGETSWSKYLGSSVFNEALPTPDGGVVATPCSGAQVHRLDARGETTWLCELEPQPCYDREVKGRFVQDGLGRLLLNGNGRLYAVDLQSGEKLWSRDLEPERIWFNAHVAVTPDNHILTNGDSTLQLLDPDGKTQWVWSGKTHRRIDQLPPETWKEHLDGQAAPLSCPPAVSPDGQRLYGGGVSTEDTSYQVVALDRQGQLAWGRELSQGMRVESLQVGADGTVYAVGTSYVMDPQTFRGTSTAEVHALSPQGETIWSFKTPKEGTGFVPFALGADQVYLSSGKKVYALRPDALKSRCKELESGATIHLGADDYVLVGGTVLKKRKAT
ncbi:MAG: hypothetical protein AMXMBFR33_48730 [Candidatus Xenobia bacterium]